MKQKEDMIEMIRHEIQSISVLEERIAFKSLMEQVFLPLYETNEQMYSELEKRIQDELAYDVNRYLIKTSIIERKFYDATHHLMSPMDDRDLTDISYNISDIVEKIEKEKAFSLMKVMLRCDYLQVQDIWKQELEFEGIIETGSTGQTWKIIVKLRQNKKYLKMIEHLYHLFIKNGIPWQTVNAPYLYKMADVVITEIPDGVKENEIIKRVQINFEKYNKIILNDLVPIWNIQKLKLNSIGFPVPCEDHMNYEHSISIQEFGNQHAYLAEDDLEIQSISQWADRLKIISGVSEAKKWNVYVIKNSTANKFDHYTYPTMQNERAENFSEKFHKRWDQCVKTKTELIRFIKGFCLEDYVIYQNCEIVDSLKKRNETYSMNPFIVDEIRNTQAQKKLLLYFRPGNKELWLQRDVASFLVSEVQRIYPEYECMGMIV